jgi:hypothetical protein
VPLPSKFSWRSARLGRGRRDYLSSPARHGLDLHRTAHGVEPRQQRAELSARKTCWAVAPSGVTVDSCLCSCTTATRSPGAYPRWLCRARNPSASMTPSGRRCNCAAAIASPCASGRFDSLPPHQWACARAGRKGQKKTLINLITSLFCLHGTSADVPIVRCTQINC